MRTVGEGVLKIMDDFEIVGGFQGTNYGRPLGVFWKHLLLDLRGQDCGKRVQI